jgi:hypothetical protein
LYPRATSSADSIGSEVRRGPGPSRQDRRALPVARGAGSAHRRSIRPSRTRSPNLRALG